MTLPITTRVARGAAGTFDNLLGRRNAKAKENAAEDDEEKMEDEENASPEEKAEDMPPEDDAEDGEEEAEDEEDQKAAKSAAYRKGASDERGRIKAILNSKEATGKGASAMHLALNTNLSVDDAKATLAGLAAEKGSRLDDAMKSAATKTGQDGGRPNPDAGNNGWDKITAGLNARFGVKK